MVKVQRKYHGNVVQEQRTNHLRSYTDGEGNLHITTGNFDGRCAFYEIVITPVELNQLINHAYSALNKINAV